MPQNEWFPEDRLNVLTPQIYQIALNIAQFLDAGEAGQIGKVWDASSQFAQQTISRNDFVLHLQALHQGLGDLVKRDYVNTVYKAFTKEGQIPIGQYITVNYLAQFNKGPEQRKESVVFVYKTGQWKLVGYSILNK